MLHLLPLLLNKDVMFFLIQMQYKKLKKDFITKGGWRTPKSIFWMLLSNKTSFMINYSRICCIQLYQTSWVVTKKES